MGLWWLNASSSLARLESSRCLSGGRGSAGYNDDPREIHGNLEECRFHPTFHGVSPSIYTGYGFQ